MIVGFAQLTNLFGRRQRIFSIQLSTAFFDLRTKLAVVIATVEPLDKALTIRIDDGQDERGAIDGKDVTLYRRQHFTTETGVRQQVGAIAQDSST
ncbi:hypothetical protein D3C85_649020 [compost metagenome]